MNKIKSAEMDSLQYMIQEKVHGTNCCLVTDGQTVHFAKRMGWAEPGETFYQYEELLERRYDKTIYLPSSIKEKYADTISVAIYGEMFGGKYPHSEVKNDSRVMCIQKRVTYYSGHDFYAFDLFIKESDNSKYLSVDEANLFFEKGQFLYAKSLFQGFLEECLQYPNAFQGHIAGWLGLPSVEDNICEGIVIRPVEPVFYNNSSRLLLKSKNCRFVEKKSIKKRQPSLFVELIYSEELNQLLETIEGYVTENRLNNVISKIGQISIPKDTGKLIGLFSKDVLEDFLKEHTNSYALLEKSEQKILNQHISKLATSIIKKVLMNQ